MSKILGIISEYNPFHNGHKYHLEESKKISNCDLSICIISGNFTQRGNCSIVDKWSKAKMALLAGVDLVLELPVIYSISSAENFSDGAIKILENLGIVDYLSFGSEAGNIDELMKVSNYKFDNSNNYNSIIKEELSKGASYPKAQDISISKALGLENILTPNNILGIEYLTSLKKSNSNIIPITIHRNSCEYNSNKPINNIASSTAIRNLIIDNKFDEIENYAPSTTFQILKEKNLAGELIPDITCFNKEIIYRLRTMSIEDILNLPDVSEELGNKIKKYCLITNNISDLSNLVKSKNVTYVRIQRILLYALLGITKEDMEISKNTTPYIRILGFNSKGKKLLSEISKHNPDIHLVTSLKDFEKKCNDKNLLRLLKIDINSTNIYTLSYKNNSISNLDYTTKIMEI